MNEIMLAIYESERHGEISLDQRDAMLDILTEGVFSNPLRKFRSIITDIKANRLKEYSSNSDIKDYVDKNYSTIIKVCDLLEKEPDELRKNEIKYMLASGVSFLAFMIPSMMMDFTFTAVATSMFLDFFVLGIVMIGLIVTSVIAYNRVSTDNSVMNDLIKIKSSLLKIKNSSKIDKATSNKITDIIDAIDDAYTEFSSHHKVSESVIDNSLVDSVFESMFD